MAKASINELRNILSATKKFPACPSRVYAGPPGQGDPDETRLNQSLGGRHWTDFDDLALTRLIIDDLPLIIRPAFLLLLPRILLDCSLLQTKRKFVHLAHFCEYVSGRLPLVADIVGEMRSDSNLPHDFEALQAAVAYYVKHFS